MEKMNKLEALLKRLFYIAKWVIDKEFTGQLRLNFHKGDLSEKIEKKDSMKLQGVKFDGTLNYELEGIEEPLTSPPPMAKGE